MRCCNHGHRRSKSYKNFIWRYKNPVTKIPLRTERKISQFSLNHKLIKNWENSYEINQELGFKTNSIVSACDRKNGKSQGYMWKYTQNKETNNE